jgi:hypothetical protein
VERRSGSSGSPERRQNRNQDGSHRGESLSGNFSGFNVYEVFNIDNGCHRAESLSGNFSRFNVYEDVSMDSEKARELAHGHRLPVGVRVVAKPVLGGLHHEYRLESAA